MQFLPIVFEDESHCFQVISKNILQNYILSAFDKIGKLLFIGIVEHFVIKVPYLYETSFSSFIF